jgi:lipopolysaccharide/colanic/teichoic acid biosynthesis glycosyltransferase
MSVDRSWPQDEPAPSEAVAWPRPKPAYDLLSRLLDVVVAAVVLVVLSPLWLAIAALVRTTSPGPALFRRTVVGKGGRRFTYYKFRSMVDGDDSHHREWLRDFVTRDAPYQEGRFKVIGDRRITPVGRWLRRLSVDEVPQLINVVRGDMSIVGPRPPILEEFHHYDATSRRRLAVKPGITGLYQVTARGRVPFSQMRAIDLDYIERRSLRLDLVIMVRTIAVMLSGKGAD